VRRFLYIMAVLFFVLTLLTIKDAWSGVPARVQGQRPLTLAQMNAIRGLQCLVACGGCLDGLYDWCCDGDDVDACEGDCDNCSGEWIDYAGLCGCDEGNLWCPCDNCTSEYDPGPCNSAGGCTVWEDWGVDENGYEYLVACGCGPDMATEVDEHPGYTMVACP